MRFLIEYILVAVKDKARCLPFGFPGDWATLGSRAAGLSPFQKTGLQTWHMGSAVADRPTMTKMPLHVGILRLACACVGRRADAAASGRYEGEF